MHPIIEKVINTLDLEYNLFGVFLIGSQNYNLDLENSDFDTVALVLPTIDNLYYGEKYIKEKNFIYKEGICKIADIRDFYKGLSKSNLNYVELLFSKEYWVNDDYEIFYTYLRDNQNLAGTLDKKSLINCAVGLMNVSHKRNIDWNSTNGNNHYNSYHILRMCNFINSFIRGKSLDECFISQEIYSLETIKDFKSGGITNTCLSIDKIIEIVEKTKFDVNVFLSNNSLDKEQQSLANLREVFNYILDKHFDFLKKF